MAGALQHIGVLECNIFTLTPIILAFYKNFNRRIDKNILFAYLIFPIVLSEYVSEIPKISIRSNLTIITDNTHIMSGFEDRFDYYKDLTNKCLQYAIECGCIEIDQGTLNVIPLKDVKMYSSNKLNTALAVASKLPKVFKKDIVSTYIQFGIHQV